jgi:hypothetical protein
MAISKTRAGHFIPTEIQKQGDMGLLKIGYPWVPQNPKVDHQCPVVKTAPNGAFPHPQWVSGRPDDAETRGDHTYIWNGPRDGMDKLTDFPL